MSKPTRTSQAVGPNLQHTLLPRSPLLQEALLDCLDPLVVGTWWREGLREIVRDPREADQMELWEGRTVREEDRSTPRVKGSTELGREDGRSGFDSQLWAWISLVFPLMTFFFF